jgi:transcriptional regulator with XRE-family HTH domain
MKKTFRLMINQIRKNYLRTYRKKFGLTQRQLSFLLGLNSGCRISILENGRRFPNIREIIIFSKLFDRPLSALWPWWIAEYENVLDLRISKLVDDLQRSQVRSNRKRRRTDYVLRRLESLHLH